MRIALTLVATIFVALGLWLIASGFMLVGAGEVASGSQVTAPPQPTAGPVAVGLALLVGGALFFVMLLRRR